MENQKGDYKPVSFIKVFTITLYVWITLVVLNGIIFLLLLTFTDLNLNFNSSPKYKTYQQEKYDFDRATEAVNELQNK
jgi:hypothetical protein